jgi:hypothetical protein
VTRTVRVARRHQPNPATAPYYRLGYAEYRATLDRMRPTWRRLAGER